MSGASRACGGEVFEIVGGSRQCGRWGRKPTLWEGAGGRSTPREAAARPESRCEWRETAMAMALRCGTHTGGREGGEHTDEAGAVTENMSVFQIADTCTRFDQPSRTPARTPSHKCVFTFSPPSLGVWRD